MRFSLHASGYSYVTVNNLVSFLGEPAAIASLCMEVAVLLLCAALEAGCLVTAFQAAAESRRLSVLAIFQGGLSKTAAEVRRGGWPWFLIAAVHSFLIHLFLLYRLLCHVRPLKFILTAVMSERWGWLIPACVVALFIAIAVPTAFVGFGCMVEQRSFKGSLKRSLELLRGNYVHTEQCFCAGGGGSFIYGGDCSDSGVCGPFSGSENRAGASFGCQGPH